MHGIGALTNIMRRQWLRAWRGRLHRSLSPVTTLTEPEARRARVLAWLLLTLVLLLLATLVLVLLVNDAADPRQNLYTVLIAGLLTVLMLAYFLTRTGRYRTAVWLTIACSVVGPWGAIALDQTIIQGDFVPLVYIVLSILLCSILLSARVTMLLAAVQVLVLLSFPQVSPATAAINWPSLLAFIIFTSALGVVSNVIIRKDLEQIERQAHLLRASEARLRDLSVRDPLTGLFNRRYMEETLDRELQRATRTDGSLGIIIADVDHFKRFNDTHGHMAGDALLCQLSTCFRLHVRGADIICRYGGEEFVFILPGASLEATAARAERLRLDIRHLPMHHAGRIFTGITISLGVAIYPDHGTTGSVVLHAADTALYRAKNDGRDRVAVAEPLLAPAPAAGPPANC